LVEHREKFLQSLSPRGRRRSNVAWASCPCVPRASCPCLMSAAAGMVGSRAGRPQSLSSQCPVG
jgi:hypothetical protein